MKKRVRPEIIGAFVLSSLIILVGFIMVFGSGALFRKTQEFVLVFDYSVNGLDIGAPVKFRGVEIGTVKRIYLNTKEKMADFTIPVYIELDKTRLTRDLGTTNDISDPTQITLVIEKGLRGQLKTQSLLTGKLYVDLDIHPEMPAHFGFDKDKSSVPELPTVPNSMEVVERSVVSILDTLNDELGPVTQGVRGTLEDTRRAVKKLEIAIDHINRIVGENSALAYQIPKAVDEISQAARAIRDLAEFLEQNPDALLRGRKADAKR